MSDFNYTLTLADIGLKLVDLVGDTIKIAYCSSAYTPDRDADHYLADIPGGAIKATGTLAGKSFTGAALDATDNAATSTPGDTITQAVIYQDTGSSATSRLIRKISADTYAGFPFLTNGANINIVWPNDTNKIFKFVNA